MTPASARDATPSAGRSSGTGSRSANVRDRSSACTTSSTTRVPTRSAGVAGPSARLTVAGRPGRAPAAVLDRGRGPRRAGRAAPAAYGAARASTSRASIRAGPGGVAPDQHVVAERRLPVGRRQVGEHPVEELVEVREQRVDVPAGSTVGRPYASGRSSSSQSWIAHPCSTRASPGVVRVRATTRHSSLASPSAYARGVRSHGRRTSVTSQRDADRDGAGGAGAAGVHRRRRRRAPPRLLVAAPAPAAGHRSVRRPTPTSRSPPSTACTTSTPACSTASSPTRSLAAHLVAVAGASLGPRPAPRRAPGAGRRPGRPATADVGGRPPRRAAAGGRCRPGRRRSRCADRPGRRRPAAGLPRRAAARRRPRPVRARADRGRRRGRRRAVRPGRRDPRGGAGDRPRQGRSRGRPDPAGRGRARQDRARRS